MSEEIVRDFPFKIKLQQSAKGFSYWECQVKTDNLDDMKILLDKSVKLAKEKCDELNKIIT